MVTTVANIQKQQSKEEKPTYTVTMLHCAASQQNLSTALKALAKAVSKRSCLPILVGVHLSASAKDNTLTLRTTNLEAMHVYVIPAGVVQDGEAVVPFSWLESMIKTMSKSTSPILRATGTRIEGEGEKTYGHHFFIQAAGRTSDIAAMDPDEFPAIPAFEESATITLPVEIFKRAVAEVAIAAAADDSRPVFTGINMNVEMGKLCLTAADAFRLGLEEIPIDEENQPDVRCFSGLFPAVTLAKAAKFLPSNVQIQIAVRRISLTARLTAGPMTVYTRLIEGTFPKYREIMPKSRTVRFFVNRKLLLGMLESALPVAKESSNILKLSGKDNVLFLDAQSEAGKFRDELTVQMAGDTEGWILVNIAYLLDVLKVLQQETVTIDLLGHSRPLTIKPVDSSAITYTHVIMPMSTNK